jgi:Mor family transcriptional regulator
MRELKRDLQAVTKEFKTLTKKTKQLTNTLAKTAVAELQRAQAAIKLQSPAQHAANALKALGQQTEKLIKAIDKFEKEKAAKKKKAKPKPKAARKARAKKPTATKLKAQTSTDQVVNIIKRSKKGADIPTLIKKTRLSDKQVRNIIFRSSKQGKIKRAGRGVYVAA